MILEIKFKYFLVIVFYSGNLRKLFSIVLVIIKLQKWQKFSLTLQAKDEEFKLQREDLY